MPQWNDTDDVQISPRLQRQRTIQLQRAKAQIWLACEEAGPHMAVILLNDALREQLDRLAEEDCIIATTSQQREL
jgi:hypothetical protein